MELGQYADASYEAGDVVVKVHVSALLKPALQAIKDKVDSGAIDPIKGTDLDKVVLDKAIEALLAVL